jgi:uncharacterized membrane protein
MGFAWLVDRVGGAIRSQVFLSFWPLGWQEWTAPAPLLNIFSIIIAAALVTAIGHCSRYIIFLQLIRRAELGIATIPGLGRAYYAVKQLVNAVWARQNHLVEKVVLAEFPRRNSFAIGFLTNRAQGELQAKTREEVVAVFVPTVPNPTTGFLIFYPSSQVVPLEMTVTQALKLIISGGVLTPSWGALDACDTSKTASSL